MSLQKKLANNTNSENESDHLFCLIILSVCLSLGPLGEDRALFHWDLLFWGWYQAGGTWFCFSQGFLSQEWLECNGLHCCAKWV